MAANRNGASKKRSDIAERGDAIYFGTLQKVLEPKHKGKYVAIDVETGEYEVAKEEMTASNRIHARLPECRVWMRRIGFPYVRRFGGRTLRKTL